MWLDKGYFLCDWMKDFSRPQQTFYCYVQGNSTERKFLKLADCILILILNLEVKVLWFTPDFSVMSFMDEKGVRVDIYYSFQVLKTIIRTNVLRTVNPN